MATDAPPGSPSPMSPDAAAGAAALQASQELERDLLALLEGRQLE